MKPFLPKFTRLKQYFQSQHVVIKYFKWKIDLVCTELFAIGK